MKSEVANQRPADGAFPVPISANPWAGIVTFICERTFCILRTNDENGSELPNRSTSLSQGACFGGLSSHSMSAPLTKPPRFALGQEKVAV